MLRRTLTFGFKNFQNHMGINNNLTLGGLIRRAARKYPKTYNFIKKGSLLCGTYFVMLSLIPGATLPLQKTVKLSILSFTHIALELWYYSLFSNEPESYLIKLNEIVLSVLNQQIYDINFLGSYFAQIRDIVRQQKRQLRQTAYFDLVLYTGITLQHILRYEKRMLLQKELYNHCQWICNTAFQSITKATQKENKNIRLLYTLIQYLLNFAPEGHQSNVIQAYHRFVTQKDLSNQTSFSYSVVKAGLQQTEFKSSLKQAYSKTVDQSLRKQILQIFESMNKVYESQSTKT